RPLARRLDQAWLPRPHARGPLRKRWAALRRALRPAPAGLLARPAPRTPCARARAAERGRRIVPRRAGPGARRLPRTRRLPRRSPGALPEIRNALRRRRGADRLRPNGEA